MRLRLSADPRCRPAEVSSVRLTAMGDFPLRDEWVRSFDPAEGALLLPDLPAETEEVAVRASGRGWEGAGLWRRSWLRSWRRSEELREDLLLLPLGLSCRLSDPLEGAIRRGAALLSLPQGGMLALGGLSGGVATREIFELPPGASAMRLSDRGTVIRRAEASATLLEGGRILVAGGASADDGFADDTYEIIDFDSISPREGVAGALAQARREHAAIALSSTRALLVGGRGEGGGPALGSLEEVSLEEGGRLLSASLLTPRLRPTLMLRGEAELWVAGGLDGSGAPIASVEAVDLQGGVSRELGRSPVQGEAVALPGDRVAFVGGAEELEVGLLLLGADPVASESLRFPLPALSRPRLLSLGDGRLLIEGLGVADSLPHAYLLDPGVPAAEELPLEGAPDRLLALADGSLAELSSASSALRRQSLRSPVESLSGRILFGLEEDRRIFLAQDAPSRWEARGTALVALVSGARIDLSLLRYRDFSAELVASGSLRIWLLGEAGRSELRIEPASVELEGCVASRLEGEALRLIRRGGRLRIEAGGGSVECALGAALDPGERVGLAFVAEPGASLGSLTVERLR